ncbi:MAG: hypothetical protein WKF40_05980 [Thermoleophilaceae bacterium]
MAISPERAALDALGELIESSARSLGDRLRTWCEAARPGPSRARPRRRARTRAPPARRRAGGGGGRRAGRGVRLRRRGQRHRLRRLRRGLQPRAADRRGGALQLGALAARVQAERRPRCGSAPERRQRSRASGAAIARAEGFEVHAQSMEARMGENPAT